MRDIATKDDIRQALENQTLRLTVRMGAMLVGWVCVILALVHLSPPV